MLRLRPTPLRLERVTIDSPTARGRSGDRRFQIVSLPQKDGSFVASVVEAPGIVVYDRSRKAAERRATDRFLKTPDPETCLGHPLASTNVVTIDMEYDVDSESYVTFVKELHGMSSFGSTEIEALEATGEMIRGYIRSMEANGHKIPLSSKKLAELKKLVGID